MMVRILNEFAVATDLEISFATTSSACSYCIANTVSWHAGLKDLFIGRWDIECSKGIAMLIRPCAIFGWLLDDY